MDNSRGDHPKNKNNTNNKNKTLTQQKQKKRPTENQSEISEQGGGSGDHVTLPPHRDLENNVEIESETEEEEEEEQVISATLNLNLQSNQLTTSVTSIQDDLLGNGTESFDLSNESTKSSPPDLLTTDNASPPDLPIDAMTPLDSPREDNLNLPPTVSILKSANVTVYLVGTAHFSLESQEDVRRTIAATQPSLVLLELCHSRRDILSLDEETILREAKDISFKKLRSTLTGSSGIQGILHLVLLSMSAQLTKKLGMAPGGEFRAAMQEARKIDKCLVVLGDRPFNVTLSRALHSLSFKQKIKLAWQFLTNTDDITKEEIEKCKEKDLLEKMLLEMTGEFPSITEVFLTERDLYLAHSLHVAAQQHHMSNNTIVGVVGMGHVPGIIKYFGNTTEQQITELSKLPTQQPPSLATRLLKSSIKLSLIALATYGCYRILKNNTSIIDKIQTKFIHIQLN